MSTRSVIARPEGEGFIGRYAHWDGYPTCRGAQLWQTYIELGGDVEAVRKYAIREGERGYWSSYGPPSEFTTTDRTADNTLTPSGWCVEDSDNMVRSDGDDFGTEWAYVLTPTALVVCERRYGSPDSDQGHGTGMFGYGASDTAAGGYWKIIASPQWNEPEPDWEAIENTRASEEQE